jgi:WD40 repeat protein
LSLNIGTKKMNYKKWLLNGLILCGFSGCFGAQDAQQVGWINHDAPEALEEGQFYNSKTLDMEDPVCQATLSPDEKLLGVASFSSKKIINTQTGDMIRSFSDKAWSSPLVWLYRGPYIVYGSGSNIKMTNVITGALACVLKLHTRWIGIVAVSLDDTKIVSGSADKIVKVWDIRSEKSIRTLEGHTRWVNSVLFSSDGNTIVSGSLDETIKLWDIRSEECIQTLKDHTYGVVSVAMSSDGNTIVSGSEDKTVKVWDIRSEKSTRTLEGHTFPVNSVAMSSDGKTVVSGSDDNTLKLWDRDLGICMQTLEGHTDPVKSVAISLDSKKIFSGSYDKTVKLWEQK